MGNNLPKSANKKSALLPYRFIEKLKKLSFIKSIYLFGSRARGDQSKTSDIDLAIDCPTAGEKDWLQIMDVIEDADTLLKIDCVRLEQANTRLKENIYREGVKLYERR